MKRQSVRLITVALAVAGIGGCFKDPTSSLRNGPTAMALTRSAVFLPAPGDSTQVEARLLDAQGNSLPMPGTTWTVDNAAIADVHVATQQLPDDASSRAYILGVAPTGGVTTVHVTSRGVSDSIKVTMVPTALAASATVVAGDSVTITAPAGYTFNVATTAINLGGNTTYLLSVSTSAVRAIARAPYTGVATLRNVSFSGGVGSIAVPLDSVHTANSVTVAKATLPAASVAVVNDVALGANTRLKVTPPAGTKFLNTPSVMLISALGANVAAPLVVVTADSLVAIRAIPYTGTVMVGGLKITASGAAIDSLRTTGNSILAAAAMPAANVVVRTGPLGAATEMKVTPPAGTTFSTTASNVLLGAATGTKLVNTVDSIVVISTLAYTGTVKVTNLVAAASGNTIDSLRTVGNSTISAAPFPGSFVLLGAGGLLDTIQIIGGANSDFTTSGANVSVATINGGAAFILRRAADTLYVFSTRSGTSAVTITNVVVGTALISTMSSAGTVTVGTTSAELNEPANNAPGGVVITAGVSTATAANPYIIYGTINGDGLGTGPFGESNGIDAHEYFTFTLATARTLTLQLQFPGTGGGGGTNPDIDFLVCSAVNATQCTAFAAGGTSGATAGQPENSGPTLAAGTYTIWINGYDTANVTFPYRLSIF